MNTLARFSTLIIALLLVGGSFEADRYEALPDSMIWIEGTSTMGTYSCAGDRVVGFGRLDQSHSAHLTVEIAVPVRSFDCGIGQMNDDLTDALKADAHPAISFSLSDADWSPGSFRTGVWVPISAIGELEVAGETRRVTFSLHGQRQADGLVRVRGEQSLRMTDFNVEPPSGLLGLVRSHNDIVVRFDLRAAQRSIR